jgi:hypothetical protein
MARINGSGFKMKSSPAKGKLQDFFNTIGSQLKSNRKDIGGELKEKYSRTKKSTPKAGESQYQANVRTRRATNKAKRSMIDKDKDGMSDLIQAPQKAPKGQETESSKTGQFVIGNRTYRKRKKVFLEGGFAYRPDALFEYSLSPDDPESSWQIHNTRDPKYPEIIKAYEEANPINKKSSGFKMPGYGKRNNK